MFLKSFIAAIIIIAFTGGFIYWGLAPQAATAQRIDITRDETPPSTTPAVQDAPKAKRQKGWVDLSLREQSNPSTDSAQAENQRVKGLKELLEKRENNNSGSTAKTMQNNITTEKAIDFEEAIKQDLAEAHRTINTGLSEAKKISQPDLQDQAYLRLVDYAVVNKIFGRANTITKSLSSPELRDTARSRVAIGMARNGQADKAYKLLDEVEVEALKDVLRVQVIEAATEL